MFTMVQRGRYKENNSARTKAFDVSTQMNNKTLKLQQRQAIKTERLINVQK